MLNLLYHSFCVNLLLFIFVNIIFIANCCISFWHIRPIIQFADSTKDFIFCPYAKRTKRPSLERPSCVLHTYLQSFLPVPAELRQRQVGVFLLRPADAPLIVEDEQIMPAEVLHPLRVRGEVVGVYDFSEPENPKLLGKYKMPSNAGVPDFYKGKVLVPCGYAGLMIQE